MKREFLEGLGLEKDVIDKIMDENGKDITKEQNKYTALETERDKYKEQLETAQASLEEFKDVDVKELKGKIEQLNADIQTKDTEYQKKIADMQFENELKDAITQFGGRSVKSVTAELDIDTLKASKNRNEDIKKALESCKEQHGFLFGSDEPINNANVGSTQGTTGDNTALNTLRTAFGLETK